MNYVRDFVFMIRYILHLKPGVLLVYPLKIAVNTVKPLILLIYPKLILDAIMEGRDFSEIIRLAVGMVAVTFVLNSAYNILQNIWSHYYNILSAAVGYEHLKSNLACKFECIEDSGYLDLQQKVRDNLNPTDYMYFISSLIENFVQIAAYFYMIFAFDYTFLIGIVLYSTVNYFVNRKINREDYEYRQILSPISRAVYYFYNLASDPFHGKDIRVNGLSTLIQEKMNRAIDRKIKVVSEHTKKNGTYRLLLLAVSLVWEGYLYYSIIAAAVAGDITIGSFSMYLGVLANLVNQISSLLSGVDRFGYWSKTVALVREYQKMGNNADSGTLSVEGIDRVEIEFRNVWFKYPGSGDFALRNVSLKIQPGERLAVVGRNGAGKSTFVKLLCRLYEPTEGEILINGVDIRAYTMAEYASLLTTVLQDFKLFAYSVKENIVLQNEEDAEKLRGALRKANVNDRVERLANGLETSITKEFDDNGVDFSGGERQKIAIARAIYRNSKIFILDEPNSSMDPLSEQNFYENFNSITENKTTVYISHRLASAKYCDRIAVFAGGELAEYGTHDVLIAKGGIYADLFHKQASGYVYGVD